LVIKGCRDFIKLIVENNTCLVLVWFGKWPEYFPHFLESCNRNPGIDWLIFSDNEEFFKSLDHIRFIHLDPSELMNRVEKETGQVMSLKDPYKVCDLKPVFGNLFRDFLKHYEFWGYCDPDILWGNILNFITPSALLDVDVLSCYPGFLCGPLTLYRNVGKVNNLYRDYPDFRKILLKENCLGFDENIQRKEIRGWTFRKMVTLVRFILSGEWKKSWKEDHRYHFQWYVKKTTADPASPSDMTEIIWNAVKKGKISVTFLPLMVSEPYYSRTGRRDWGFTLSGNQLVDSKTGKEALGFHFQESKSKPGFSIEKTDPAGRKIIIDKGGIRYG
jgi:hypothetical protein